MARRSKLGQWTSSASAKAEVLSPAVSLSVQRVTVPLVRSSEYASAGVRAELRVKPSSAPLFRQRRSEEHTSELQSHSDLVCRLLLEKKKKEERRHAT